jgi:hypothetical protein
MIPNVEIDNLTDEVGSEVKRAMGLFPPIHNMHEGLGVIEEEWEEFRKEVFLFNLAKGRDTRLAARKELVQLAAMCIRTIVDCEINYIKENENVVPTAS